MGYAVELYFDPDSDLAIRRIWSGIADAFGLSTMLTNGGRPHVSLAVYSDDLDHRSFLQELPAFSKSLAPLEVQLGSVGTFPTEESVVFLAPVVTRELLAVHERFHTAFSGFGGCSSAHYLPGNWVPHSTVATDLTGAEIGQVGQHCWEHFRPKRGWFQEIGLVEFRPVRELATFKLGST